MLSSRPVVPNGAHHPLFSRAFDSDDWHFAAGYGGNVFVF
jgi:hypothetical protein